MALFCVIFSVSAQNSIAGSLDKTKSGEYFFRFITQEKSDLIKASLPNRRLYLLLFDFFI